VPSFLAVDLQVQRTVGVSDYVRRDLALKNLIQPLAGEYGMHNHQPQRECVGGVGEWWGGVWGGVGWGVGGVIFRRKRWREGRNQ
jgi:hypothetical protein